MNETTIWKFDVPIVGDFVIKMPEGAEILSVQTQHNNPQLWALVSPGHKKERRRFRLIGTGHSIIDFTPAFKFIGTVQVEGGSLVFHLFEVL